MQPNHYDMLSEQDVQQIHEASLEVLQNTGLAVDHPEAREQLAEAGATLESKGNRVFIPADMVEAAIHKAPKSFICAGRSAEYDMLMSSGISHAPVARSVGGPLNLFDFSSHQSRQLTIHDCTDLARIVAAPCPH